MHLLRETYSKYILKGWLWNVGFNFVINGVFPFLGFVIPFFTPFPDPVPIIGDPSVGLDMFWMCLYLGFLLPGLTTQGIYQDIADKAKVPPTKIDRRELPFVSRFPRNTLVRSLMFCVACLLTFFPLVFLLQWIFGVNSLPFYHFVVFKATYGAIMAAILDPLVRVAAMTDREFTTGNVNVKLWPLIKYSAKYFVKMP